MFRLIALIGVIGLSGCIVTKEKINLQFAEHPFADTKFQPSTCNAHVTVSNPAAKPKKKFLGNVFTTPIVSDSIAAWATETLSDKFENRDGDPKLFSVDLKFLKGYVGSSTSLFIANTVVVAKYKTSNGETSEKIYRGTHNNWNMVSEEVELKNVISSAMSDAVTQIDNDLTSRCRSIARFAQTSS